MRVTDVLCLSVVPIGSQVLGWLDAEGQDTTSVQASGGSTSSSHGMRLSYKKPATYVEEHQSLEQQHANRHGQFIKLCLLMSGRAVSADCLVNIDETSCRLLPLHQIGMGRRGVKQAQL